MSVKPLKTSTHLKFWAFALALFTLIVFVLKSALLPFVLGMAVAYLLNPIVNRLGALGLARGPAAMLILVCFLIVVFGFVGVVSPIIYREISLFSQDLPQYLERIMAMLAPLTEKLDSYIGGADKQTIEEMLKSNSGSAVNAVKFIFSKIAASGQAVMDVLSVAIFMPIVAYFMMKEWPAITRWAQDLMPRHSEETIMDLLKQIDQKLSGFVRGQVTVAVFLGIGYAIALTISGLKYGFMIGLLSGLLSIIPMVGSAVGLIVSVAVAWFQSGDLMFVGIIAAIFIAGQLIEGNILTPKLVGDSVGLHPLWVFFALLAGGSLLGVLGMFLAVPVAAVIGVIVSFLIYKYKQSAYYLDPEVEESEQAQEPSAKKASLAKTKKTKTQKTKKTKA